MMMKTTLVLAAVLLLCVVGLDGRPRKGGRGQKGHGKQHQRRVGLKDLVCASENSAGLSRNSSCPGDAACNAGPLTFNRGNVTVDVTLCAIESQLLLAACRVENTTGVVVYPETECHDESSCSLGPLPLTHDSEAVLAYYCMPREESSSSKEDSEEEHRKPRKGRRGKKSGSSKSSESSEE